MGDVANVEKKVMEVTLGGKVRKIRYGMKAWTEIQKKYKGLEGVGRAMADDQPGTIVGLVGIGLVKEDGETITDAKLIDWLDEAYDIGGAVQLAKDIMDLIQSTLPTAKAGASSGDPQ